MMGWKSCIKVLMIVEEDNNFKELEKKTQEEVKREIKEWGEKNNGNY